jgi:branched-chain amino acid aminotransferase
MAEHFFMYNNQVYPVGQAVISAQNRSFRYGDGLFETMKMVKGNLLNKEFHFDRLFLGLSLLQFEIPKDFDLPFLEKKIGEVAVTNGLNDQVRVRLMIFRGDGNIFDTTGASPNFIIETFPLVARTGLEERGLVVDVFPAAQKSCDIFSNIKSNNYLPYVMAGIFAAKNNLDECILLNAFGRVCESTIANIFIVKGTNIYTPPLSEGCVVGTMRRWLLEILNLEFPVIEKELSVDDLLEAEELFLTNAISHIRWASGFRDKKYVNIRAKEIYSRTLQTICRQIC